VLSLHVKNNAYILLTMNQTQNQKKTYLWLVWVLSQEKSVFFAVRCVIWIWRNDVRLPHPRFISDTRFNFIQLLTHQTKGTTIVIRLLQASAALTFWQSANRFPTTLWRTNFKNKGPHPRKLSQRRTTRVTIQCETPMSHCRTIIRVPVTNLTRGQLMIHASYHCWLGIALITKERTRMPARQRICRVHTTIAMQAETSRIWLAVYHSSHSPTKLTHRFHAPTSMLNSIYSKIHFLTLSHLQSNKKLQNESFEIKCKQKIKNM